MAHEDVLISVGAKGGLLLDNGVGDVLVIENVVFVLTGGVYLVLVTPVSRAVLRIGTIIIILSSYHFDYILIISEEDKWTFSTFFNYLNCTKLQKLTRT